MRRFYTSLPCCALLFLVVFTGVVHGQIELGVELPYRTYLQFEPVPARTTVRSLIGQPVIFNAGDGGPTFYYAVRDVYGSVLPMRPDVQPPEPLLMAAQGSAVLSNDMSRLYSMTKPGQYSIQACVDWMGKTYRGEKRHVEIVAGREITRITGVVPSDRSTRTYMVFHINREQQDHILLRIDDESAGVSYGVYPLGRSVLNEKPQLAIDAGGSAHILYQTAPRVYAHVVYSPHGSLMDTTMFGADYIHVKLESQPGGSITATGRRVDPDVTGPAVVETILDRSAER